MGGKAVSCVISIVLLLVVVEATQFSISIPRNSGLTTVACCPNAKAATCFAKCWKNASSYFDLAKVCPLQCNCPLVKGSKCNAVWGVHPPSTTLGITDIVPTWTKTYLRGCNQVVNKKQHRGNTTVYPE